jgi:hypothetical protein
VGRAHQASSSANCSRLGRVLGFLPAYLRHPPDKDPGSPIAKGPRTSNNNAGRYIVDGGAE